MWNIAATVTELFFMLSRNKSRTWACLTGAALLLSSLATTGCQISTGGQTLPSAYHLKDDIQYFPKGPEFKLSREAAALKEARAEESLRR
jgi:hypothetical protein